MPPNGGYGANTGIHDAHYIAWKLALVVAGQATRNCSTRTGLAQRSDSGGEEIRLLFLRAIAGAGGRPGRPLHHDHVLDRIDRDGLAVDAFRPERLTRDSTRAIQAFGNCFARVVPPLETVLPIRRAGRGRAGD